MASLSSLWRREFGRERVLVRAVAGRQALRELAASLGALPAFFKYEKDGHAALTAVLGEVIEGMVVAVVGLERACEYMTACLT